MKKRHHRKLALLCSLALAINSIPAVGLMPVFAQEADAWIPEEMPVTDADAEPELVPDLTGLFPEDVFEEEPDFDLPAEEIPDEVFEELIEDEEAISEWYDPAWEEESADFPEEDVPEETADSEEDELILEEAQPLGAHAL